MKLSTRSTYGVRAMLALALAHGGKPIMVREIAQRQHLPPSYLEQLMTQLRKAGLVSATRGARGGYLLARPPGEITVADVLEVLEGPLAVADCPAGVGCCSQPGACALIDLWAEASQGLAHVFGRLTLADLAERQRAKEASPVLMYSI